MFKPLLRHKLIMQIVSSRTLLITLYIVLNLLLVSSSADKTQVHNRSHNNNNNVFRHFDEAPAPTAAPPTSSCGACKNREDLKNRSLEIIKLEVLQKLGLKLAPNITGKVLPQVPQHLLAMVKDLDGSSQIMSDAPHTTAYSIMEEEDDYHAKTQKVLVFAQPYPRLRHSWRGHDILHFTFSDSVTKYHVSNASLFLYVKGADRRPVPDVIIEVFKVFKVPDHPEPGLHRMYVRKVAQPLGKGEFLPIDMTQLVSEWFKSPRDNYGFVVNATVNGKKVHITDTTIDNGGKAPFVDISTMESRKRVRRNIALNCDEETSQRTCCRYPLKVDFEKFGWDWVIAPKRYEANYCSGDCPYVTLQKYPYTHLKQMASPNSAQPCCIPRKLSAISMLYFDNNLNIVYGSLPGMVVERCGCS